MHKDYKELYNEIFSGKGEIPKHIRLFIADEKRSLYVNEGNATAPSTAFGMMQLMRSNRGSVLESFANFEFLTIELMRFILIGFKTNERLIKIISRMNVNQRIDYLDNWEIIDNDLARKLKKLFKIRNALAHNIMESEAIYHGRVLFAYRNFDDFKNEMQDVWNKFIEEYNKTMGSFDFSDLINEIKDHRTKVKPQTDSSSQDKTQQDSENS